MTTAEGHYALHESAGIRQTPRAAGEAGRPGRDICWELLALVSCLGASALGGCEFSQQPQAAPAASAWGAAFWGMQNSAHTCLATASQPLNGGQKSLRCMLEFN